MTLISKLHYQGFLKTPLLWKNLTVSNYRQLSNLNDHNKFDDKVEFKNRRLGKLVEEFVFFQLQSQDAIHWVCDNLQIQNGKQTIGELDALFLKKDTPIHLEIVYKFYLYDPSINTDNHLDPWLGPNRKDSLNYKLNKLHTKQFPLLYHHMTEPYLRRFGIHLNRVKQQLCFKAQLFLPFTKRDLSIKPLNSNCIYGYYLNFEEFHLLNTRKFYIPKKLDWLITPHTDVNWLNYDEALDLIQPEIDDKRSPMVWVYHSPNTIDKCFITFW